MKYTLLELTQSVLSSMDSDEVNSISDTPESLQVVNVIKTVYDDIISRGDLTSNKVLFSLDASNTTTKPVLMTKPSDIDRIEWIKYNGMKATDIYPVWNEIRYYPVEDFIQYIHSFNDAEPDVRSFEHIVNGYKLFFNYKIDTSPTFYTTVNDNTIIFDSYDSAVDDTLQTSKTLAHGQRKTEFIEEDSFIPNLQPSQFSLLLNEAKSLAWAELKQTPHAKAEQTARRGWRHLQKTRLNIPKDIFDNNASAFEQLPNFGRR